MWGLAYKVGLTKPTVLLPASSRSSLIRAIEVSILRSSKEAPEELTQQARKDRRTQTRSTAQIDCALINTRKLVTHSSDVWKSSSGSIIQSLVGQICAVDVRGIVVRISRCSFSRKVRRNSVCLIAWRRKQIAETATTAEAGDGYFFVESHVTAGGEVGGTN